MKASKLPFGPLCGVVAAANAAEMRRQVLYALRFTGTVELRLDWLRNTNERKLFLDWLRKKQLHANLIATCRRREAGGRFSGSVAAQRAILATAVSAGCDWYDLELESLQATTRGGRRFIPIVVNSSGEERAPQPIFSLHQFNHSANHPDRLLTSFPSKPAAIWKLALECRSLRQGLRLLHLARKRRSMIAIPMGRTVQPLRLLGLREGSLLTYAAVSLSTAPGQPSLEDCKHLFHAERIDKRTGVYGVIGNKTGGSTSPVMHNAAFMARGINAVYLPFFVEDLDDFLAAVKPLRIYGFSVTIPHKQAILPRLDFCDELARRLGAVNTVVVRGGRLHGTNTDYLGLLRALKGKVRLSGSRVLLLGAGGAARAAAFALTDSGANISIISRRARPAQDLAREAGGTAIQRRAVRARSFDLIVNATPLGMAPDARSPLRPNELNAPVVFDMVYRPLQTPLLRMAESRGLRALSGVEMLVAQGVAQWELWTGQKAPAALMRRAVLKALGKLET